MAEDQIVTPDWIAAIRTQYGLDTRTPQAAGEAWGTHSLVAGAITALGHALDRVEALEKDRERLDWLERDHNARVFPSLGVGPDGANWFGVRVDHEQGKGFSPNGKLREAIDAAITQATTEGATDDHPGGARD